MFEALEAEELGVWAVLSCADVEGLAVWALEEVLHGLSFRGLGLES